MNELQISGHFIKNQQAEKLADLISHELFAFLIDARTRVKRATYESGTYYYTVWIVLPEKVHLPTDIYNKLHYFCRGYRKAVRPG